ncbi:MAG: hypothetical protein JNK15_21115 [Planctomycetes bacterium]|nr:hypothetical protein [Planctomycetota bacterium]
MRAAAIWTSTAAWLKAHLTSGELDQAAPDEAIVLPPHGSFRGEEAAKVLADAQRLFRELTTPADTGK